MGNNTMKTYRLTFSANPASQVVRPGGHGYITLLTISHAESSAQAVTLYDKDGTPWRATPWRSGASPCTIAYPLPHTFWFTNGLLLHSGNCVVNLFIVY